MIVDVHCQTNLSSIISIITGYAINLLPTSIEGCPWGGSQCVAVDLHSFNLLMNSFNVGS